MPASAKPQGGEPLWVDVVALSVFLDVPDCADQIWMLVGQAGFSGMLSWKSMEEPAMPPLAYNSAGRKTFPLVRFPSNHPPPCIKTKAG